MSDHQYYHNSFPSEDSLETKDIQDFSNDFGSVTDEKKSGDEWLIELYKERPFLYDKKNPDFKNTSMKQKAWNEISKTMIAKNCGSVYTPNYCQKRCTSLREQYNREKKKIEEQHRSGRTAPKFGSRQFSFYSQLTFLDQVIKRRRTFGNGIKSQSNAVSVKKSSSGIKTYESDNVPMCSSNNKENRNVKYEETINTENSYQEVLVRSPKLKRRINETKELEQTLSDMSDRIMKDVEISKPSTADDAFMEFVKIQFDSVPEHEKHIRRKMIIDAISAPLPIISHPKHCKCNILLEELLQNTLLH